MKAVDIMTTDVVTVGSDASVSDVAKLLVQHRISGVPVVEGGKLVGIVSESDLLRRAEIGTEPRHSRWLELFMSTEGLAAEYIRYHARAVREVMTRNVVTATPETPIRQIAGLLESHGIKRLPIVQDGKIIGIVSRANLVQLLASVADHIPSAGTDDSAIREKIMAQLKSEPWATPFLINVTVRDGTVDLWGLVRSATEKKAARVVAETTPGVREVTDNLLVRPATAAG
jgi:CBS domain-containing protein